MTLNVALTHYKENILALIRQLTLPFMATHVVVVVVVVVVLVLNKE